MPNSLHYHYGAGQFGCLFDTGPYYSETYREAVECLADLFELGRVRKSRLLDYGYLELDNRRDGVDYCEVMPCGCNMQASDFE